MKYMGNLKNNAECFFKSKIQCGTFSVNKEYTQQVYYILLRGLYIYIHIYIKVLKTEDCATNS